MAEYKIPYNQELDKRHLTCRNFRVAKEFTISSTHFEELLHKHSTLLEARVIQNWNRAWSLLSRNVHSDEENRHKIIRQSSKSGGSVFNYMLHPESLYLPIRCIDIRWQHMPNFWTKSYQQIKPQLSRMTSLDGGHRSHQPLSLFHPWTTV